MDREVIEQKLESLRRCLQRAAEKCPSDPDRLGRDPDLYQAAEKLGGHAGISLTCTSGITGVHHAGCSKRPYSKAAASEEARRTLRYVEPLSAARTPLADFFSILRGYRYP